MLPYERPKGREAYKRLRVYIGVPPDNKDHELKKFPEAEASKLGHDYTTLADVAKEMGWRVREF